MLPPKTTSFLDKNYTVDVQCTYKKNYWSKNRYKCQMKNLLLKKEKKNQKKNNENLLTVS